MRAGAAIVMLLGAAGPAGRWGQTKGVLRALLLLPEVQRGMETALELDPGVPPAHALAGTVGYEVPGLFGGDLEKTVRDAPEAHRLLAEHPAHS